MGKRVRRVKCESCDTNSESWWDNMGVRLVDEYGAEIIYCKTCFRDWLKDGEDEADNQFPLLDD